MASAPRKHSPEEHAVVSRPEWLRRRRRLLAKEKALTHLRERLSRERRELPWVKVEKPYVFDGPGGAESLADLFGGRRQLVIYHFMFDPRDKAGCPHCSFWADSFNGIIAHLNQRDVTMLAVSRAPLAKLKAFKARMGWTFKWVSSGRSDFNYDYQASFTDKEVKAGNAFYNYRTTDVWCPDYPGISVFYRDRRGNVYHTYSCYSRGIDMVNAAYQFLDLVPKGRDEDPERPQSWVNFRDKYGKR
jgi:predicted dithiol-disulfide oxidoreductase (DUF899 family)